jgi:hypothetical protein
MKKFNAKLAYFSTEFFASVLIPRWLGFAIRARSLRWRGFAIRALIIIFSYVFLRHRLQISASQGQFL